MVREGGEWGISNVWTERFTNGANLELPTSSLPLSSCDPVARKLLLWLCPPPGNALLCCQSYFWKWFSFNNGRGRSAFSLVLFAKRNLASLQYSNFYHLNYIIATKFSELEYNVSALVGIASSSPPPSSLFSKYCKSLSYSFRRLWRGCSG